MSASVDSQGSPVGEPQPVIDGLFQAGSMTGFLNYDVAAEGRLLLIAQSARTRSQIACR